MGETCSIAGTSRLEVNPYGIRNNPAPRMGWYALKVRSRSESIAAVGLQNRGYEPFAPVYLERRRYSDRIKRIETAAFPGYIFCRFDPALKTPIVTSPAVDYVVGLAGHPVAICDEEIDSIRRIMDSGGYAVPYVAAGQRVRIEYGALAGLEGILQRTDRQNRVTLSVELLQRSVTVHIDLDQIQLI